MIPIYREPVVGEYNTNKAIKSQGFNYNHNYMENNLIRNI